MKNCFYVDDKNNFNELNLLHLFYIRESKSCVRFQKKINSLILTKFIQYVSFKSILVFVFQI